MRMSATGAMQTKAESMKLTGIGKMWEPGDQGTVYYPVFQDDAGKWQLLVGTVWGHPADPKILSLKTVFIPTLTKVDESGVPVGKPDITYQFARIAKAFIEGEKKSRIDKAMKKNWPTTAAQKTALEDIEKDYDTKNNLNAKKAVVGKLQYLITTECVYVPIENEKPVPDKARLVTQTLSSDRIRKIQSLLNDSKYMPKEGEKYLEVQYSFPASTKAEAGKADPVGQVAEYRLSATAEDAFKDIESLLAQLPETSETIARRNFSYRSIEEIAIKQSLMTYSIMQSEFLDDLAEEDEERLVKNAEIIDALSITDSLNNDALKEKLRAELAEINKKYAEEETKEEEHVDPDFESAPKIDDLLSGDNKADEALSEGLDLQLN